MFKTAAGCILRVCVKIAKNAVIRGAHEAAGKPLPSIVIHGAIAATDDAVDGAWKWMAGQMNPAQRLEEAEELANMTPAEIEAGVAEALKQEAPDASPEVRQHALTLAARAARNLQHQCSRPDISGRSVLDPAVRLDDASDVALLLRPPSPHVLVPGDQVAGRYTIQRFIAQGGMGAVYLATQQRMKRTVILKTILPAIAAQRAFRERFFQEAQLAAKLSHPHIVTVYEADEDPARDLCFLTMQHLPGMTLDAWLKRRPGGCSLAEFSRLAAALCAAIQHAHERGVLHLDLKPSNIMVSADLSEIYVLDFGLAKACGESAGAAALVTNIGYTPYYAAPEQLTGKRVDQRADVYALGVVFYELLTGEPPLAGCDLVAEVRPEVPTEMSAVIRSAMKRKPDERTESAEALRDAVARALRPSTGPGVTAVSPAASPSPIVAPPAHPASPASPDRARAGPLADTPELRTQIALIESAIRTSLKLGADAPIGAVQRASVTQLNLRDKPITDSGAAWLAAKDTGLKALTTLYLNSTQVTDAGVKALAATDTGLKALITLWLCDTKVTDAGVVAINQRFPGITI